jgi:hypothetical protein
MDLYLSSSPEIAPSHSLVIWPGPSSVLPLSCLLAAVAALFTYCSTAVPAELMPPLVALPSSWVGQPW